MKLTTWTLTPDVSHESAPGRRFCSVAGSSPPEGGNDPHDVRHLPSLRSALEFIFGNKIKIGDTIRMAGDGGRVIPINHVWYGSVIHYDVGTHEIDTPEELIRYLEGLLQPGDVVEYHHV